MLEAGSFSEDVFGVKVEAVSVLPPLAILRWSNSSSSCLPELSLLSVEDALMSCDAGNDCCCCVLEAVDWTGAEFLLACKQMNSLHLTTRDLRDCVAWHVLILQLSALYVICDAGSQ